MANSGDFSIGSKVWPGVSKLIEEAGEVAQVAGKLLGAAGETSHWDGSDLCRRLEDELADLMAAAEFVARMNGLDGARMNERRAEKLATFIRWHDEQMRVEVGDGG